MKLRLTALLLVALCAALPVTAQDATTEGANPLLDLLGYIPQSAATIEGVTVSYADYDALLAVREETPTVGSFEDFNALSPHDSRLWLSNLMRVGAGPRNVPRYFNILLQEMPDNIGFSFFDIARGVEFGEPPDMGTVLAGSFDVDTVQSAFEAQDFMSTEIGGLPAVCSVEGCDEGLQQNIAARNPANPFGGELGRREPLVITPEVLLNSPVLETLEAMIAASQDEQESLADDPTYRAAAEAINDGDGDLLQALFLNPVAVNTYFPPPSAEGLLEGLPEGYGELAPYELAVIADRQEGDNQVAVIVVVYRNEESAAQAAETLAMRLEVFAPPSRGTTESLLHELGATVNSAPVYMSAGGDRYVALVEVTTPLPTLDEVQNMANAGVVFRNLTGAVYRREMFPLIVFG